MSDPQTADEIIVEVVNSADVKIIQTDGAEAPGKLQFDDLRKKTIEVFQFLLQSARIQRRAELEVLGRHLFDGLFNDRILSCFEQSMSAVKDKRCLRIQLRFDKDAAEMASWPWEYLYYEPENGRGFFLSTQTDLVLSRYIPTLKPRKPLAPEERPLRILVVVSQPDDLEPVVAEPVIEAIQKLAGSAEAPLIRIERCDKPTIDNLLKAIEDAKPHVLHFIGHGRYNEEEKQGEIALLKYDEKSAAWCGDKAFAEYFVNLKAVPRLVLLHMCESGTVEFRANFAGMAPQLILAKVEAVVAMQYCIPNNAAISFSRAFYAELAKGDPVDGAVQMGRWRITIDDPKSYDSRIFGTPVLYMHSRDGIILPQSETPGQKPSLSRSGPAAGSVQTMDIQSREKASEGIDRMMIGLLQRAAMKAAGAEQDLAFGAIKQIDWATPSTIEQQLNKCIDDGSVEKVPIFVAMLDELGKQRSKL